MTLAAHLRAFVLGVAFVATPAYGRDRNVPAEQARVLDGDTLELDGIKYRLWGIDAPELKQTCDNGWQAGQYAAAVLRGLTDRGNVTCDPKTTDKYGRTVAVCWAAATDLGAEMVRQGMAWAFTRYSHDYVLQETYAKTAGLGIHSAACQPAWLYRQEKH
jgi:endonuclease YncB( thermonuclease family)